MLAGQCPFRDEGHWRLPPTVSPWAGSRIGCFDVLLVRAIVGVDSVFVEIRIPLSLYFSGTYGRSMPKGVVHHIHRANSGNPHA